MVVVVFRSRINPDVDMAQLQAVGMRMFQLASSMPGFISYKDFAASDGESVAIVEFESLADSLHWRNHPEHRVAQEQGRVSFFSEYRVQVCELVRETRQPQSPSP
jgi:heme-degrading monooxygenase HmoA